MTIGSLHQLNFEDSCAAGVLHAPATLISDIATAATQAGLTSIRLDLGACPDKASVLSRLADTFAFPAWFGHNWDALADCLADLSWLPARGYAVMIDRLPPSDADTQTLLSILADTSAARAGTGTPMWVFIAVADGERSVGLKP